MVPSYHKNHEAGSGGRTGCCRRRRRARTARSIKRDRKWHCLRISRRDASATMLTIVPERGDRTPARSAVDHHVEDFTAVDRHRTHDVSASRSRPRAVSRSSRHDAERCSHTFDGEGSTALAGQQFRRQPDRDGDRRAAATATSWWKATRRLKLNQGDEFVHLSGVVRRADIATDNTVTSDKVADAHISYSGRGVIDASNRMGWLARFFNSAFAPY